jgi:(1->4)-alpha-D-glucan 1-alpha-D-glucosylmutase
LVEPGWINSLAQTLVKLTSPGIPDIYQGMELWSFSLVDPDNRRPVDYQQRRQLLAELEQLPSAEKIWTRAAEGLPKLWVTRQALALRKRRPEWFGAGAVYQPLGVDVTGTEEPALAFARGAQVGSLGTITVVPRLALRLRDKWREACLTLPAGAWYNQLTQETLSGGEVQLSDLLARFPVALLTRSEEA